MVSRYGCDKCGKMWSAGHICPSCRVAEALAEAARDVGDFRIALRGALAPFWPSNPGVGADEIVDAVKRAAEALADPLAMLEEAVKRTGFDLVLFGPASRLDIEADGSANGFSYFYVDSAGSAGNIITRAEAASLLEEAAGISIKRPLTEEGIADVVAWSEKYPPKGEDHDAG